MRVTGGQWANRTIAVPPGLGVRPTPDKVRQAIFNSLGEWIANRIVLELFAGSGALSLECLSRGADSAVCVEKSAKYAEYIELAAGPGTVQSLNKSVPAGQSWNKTNNFFSVGAANNMPRIGCPKLGDINLRIAPDTAGNGEGASGTPWAIFDSAYGSEVSWHEITNVSSTDPNVLASHDITATLNTSQLFHGYNSTLFGGDIPVKVVRSWEKSADGNGLIMRFKLTNTHKSALKIGGLGFAMPQAGMQHGIEESVWLDPHIGADHGYVEWVRVVVS